MNQQLQNRLIIGKTCNAGIAPAVALVNPKNASNLGMVIRLASCYNVKQVWYTGDRIQIAEGERIPREERMKGYNEVQLIQYDKFFDQFKDVTPVAVEVRENAELLTEFEHPENAIYVFGPEDGGLTKVHLQHCHRFVKIPTRHCLNLATAVSTVLYDRMVKLGQAYEIAEDRGPAYAE